MAYNYVVTAHKPTSVNYALSACLTSPDDKNLVLSRANRLEVYTLTPDGLVSVIDTTVYGRIGWMHVFRPSNRKTDLLFIRIEKSDQYFVVSYENGELITLTNAQECPEHRLRASHVQVPHHTIDPTCRMIGMNLFEGYFQCIPMDPRTGTLQPGVNLRLDETRLLDVVFLHPGDSNSSNSQPTLCLLYEDERATRHLKTYIPNFKDKTMDPGPWSQSNVENGASLLIPVPTPYGGVIVVGQGMIIYHNGGDFKAVKIQSTVIETYAQLHEDGKRYLLGDMLGRVWIVVLETSDEAGSSKVTGVSIEMLGETSCASSIACLKENLVFVGSRLGDSQLIQLNHTRSVETGSYIDVLDSFTNLGPIVDFCVMDLERQGQGQIVTCSGAFKDGSLRIVRNGIGIHQQAVADIPGIKGIWSLRKSFASVYDTYLVQSFIDETRILALDGEEMDEIEFPGFLQSKTLFCHTMIRDQWLHVTTSAIRLLCATTQGCNDTWTPPVENTSITVATANEAELIVATSDCKVYYFQLNNGTSLVQAAVKSVPHEVSCLHITPYDASTNSYCAVGLWTDLTIRLFECPALTPLLTEGLGGDTMARSVLFSTFESRPYLLIGLGDGTLISFRVQKSKQVAIVDRKKVSLGTQPIFLTTFRSRDTSYAFAACDRPTVIYTHKGKIMYSNVNSKEMVNMMCPFHSEAFPECLVLVAEQDVTVGTIDGMEKLHVQTVPIHEWPRRITHLVSSRALAVCTVKQENETTEMNYIRLFDDQTFEALAGFELDQFECCLSITSCALDEENPMTQYVVVGTAYALEDEPEPHQGRILVFEIQGIGSHRKLHLVAEKSVRGAVYCLTPFHDGKLVAGVNSKTHIFKWNPATTELVSECGHHGHVLVLYTACRGDFIIVGDLMKSMILLKYSSIEGTLEEIARDLDSNWMTCVSVLSDEIYIGAEAEYNLFTLRHKMEAITDEERVKLETRGAYHLGEFVNTFRRGSLVMQSDPTKAARPPLLYGTVSGSIGLIVTIQEKEFELLQHIQAAVQQIVPSLGHLSHTKWREFHTKRRQNEAKNFVDGDLIEKVLELSTKDLDRLVEVINDDMANHPNAISIDSVIQIVEEMAQLH